VVHPDAHRDNASEDAYQERLPADEILPDFRRELRNERQNPEQRARRAERRPAHQSLFPQQQDASADVRRPGAEHRERPGELLTVVPAV
jgi:hypothetical protein